MNNLRIWKIVTNISLLGLIALIIIWNGWLSPVQHIPKSLEMILLLAPLLFFMRGILHERYNSYVQVTFPALFYFLLGIWYAVSPQEMAYGLIMTLFSTLLYLGGFFSARQLMKQDKKQSTKKTPIGQ